MDKRSEFPDPWEGRSSSDCEEQRIFIFGYKMSWSPEGDLNFGVFRKKGQQLKYIGKASTHTHGTLRTIPSRVLNRLAKLTSRNLSIHSEMVDKIYPAHANALLKAGLAPPNFLIMIDLWRKQDEKVEIEKELDVSEKKDRYVYFCVAYSHYFSTSIHRVLDRLKSRLSSHGWEYECHTMDLIT